MYVRCIAKGGQWEGGEAKGGAHLSPGTFPDPPHALLPTHESLQKVTRFCLAHQFSTSLCSNRKRKSIECLAWNSVLQLRDVLFSLISDWKTQRGDQLFPYSLHIRRPKTPVMTRGASEIGSLGFRRAGAVSSTGFALNLSVAVRWSPKTDPVDSGAGIALHRYARRALPPFFPREGNRWEPKLAMRGTEKA